MTRFTCVSVGFGPVRVNERLAETAEKAADAHATAIHSTYYTESWRTGQDSHGKYQEFSVHAGPRSIHSTVRVYEHYKH